MAEPTIRFVILHGKATSIVLETHGTCAPIWRYWGERLPQGIAPPTPSAAERTSPGFTLDPDPSLSLFPTFGFGWHGQSALLAHRAGSDYAQAITSCSTILKDEQSVRFEMVDGIANLSATVSISLDPQSDVLTLETCLANVGETDLDIQWLAAATLPLPADAATIRSFSGRHNCEFQPVDDLLSRSIWRRENRRGITSHNCFPGAIISAGGLTFGAQLAWSGNHVQTVEWLDDGRYQWQFGEWLAPGEVILAPGESISSPALLATCSTSGESGIAQNFHTAIRSRLDWPGGKMRPRPVHLNTWEGVYFKHDLDGLLGMANAAAAIGIERFVLDDGWFSSRNDDTSSLGDWWPDADKYPDGLAPLADHVAALGMEFGLWVEPEMVNQNSDLFRAHPDWALQIAGRPLITGRNQLVLDMARPEVADYLFECVAALLNSLPISYLKWDHNRNLATAGPRARYRQQVQATYALMSRIRKAFPAVEIESCAGGGGRIDAGIIRHCHRFWPSDCIDAVSRVHIQRGFLQFFPPELMGAHIGTAPAHSTGRSQMMAFRAAVALPGHFGVELDIRKQSDADRAALSTAISTYKTLRGTLHTGSMWFGDAGDAIVWQAHGDSHNLLLFVIRTSPTAQNYGPALTLDMLDPRLDYRVERIALDTPSRHRAKPTRADKAMADGGMKVAGAWLKNAGLTLPEMLGEECALFKFSALDQ